MLNLCGCLRSSPTWLTKCAAFPRPAGGRRALKLNACGSGLARGRHGICIRKYTRRPLTVRRYRAGGKARGVSVSRADDPTLTAEFYSPGRFVVIFKIDSFSRSEFCFTVPRELCVYELISSNIRHVLTLHVSGCYKFDFAFVVRSFCVCRRTYIHLRYV